ncbi:PEP-CTERM sorting domain-containing protein (plasmid) [Novosphingobium sp. THN1]|nr:PEP-CTERM sorting domain-containing protein [Novosphingobium sp. THN1]NLR41506.1 PEP-CTERM sorting domain-containing protein [Novosphingobium sp. ERW19]
MMLRKLILSTSIAGLASVATPAHATWWLKHTHYCNCGHNGGSSLCGGTTSGGTTSTSGGTTTTSGGTTTTSGGTTSTSGGTTTSSGGTQVPEPGMLGILGLGFVGLGYARARRRVSRS